MVSAGGALARILPPKVARASGFRSGQERWLARMSQVNVNTPEPVRETPPDSGGAAVAAGLNLITVLIILAVAVVIIAALIWFVTGSGVFGGSGASPVPTALPQKTSELLTAFWA